MVLKEVNIYDFWMLIERIEETEREKSFYTINRD